MPRNNLTRDIIKCEVLKLKHALHNEPFGDKDLANKYLNKVLDKIDEYAR